MRRRKRVEKPTRVWPDTHTSGPTHGHRARVPLSLSPTRFFSPPLRVTFPCTPTQMPLYNVTSSATNYNTLEPLIGVQKKKVNICVKKKYTVISM